MRTNTDTRPHLGSVSESQHARVELFYCDSADPVVVAAALPTA
ncbi:MAG: hypothetical protein ACLUB2_00695 [Butyricicoccus pullicaecorum]